VAKAHPQRRLRLYFEDESRFGQQGTIARVWVRRGSQPTAVRQTDYRYLWVPGVVRPETGKAKGLLSPLLNTDVINIFLHLSATIRENPAPPQMLQKCSSEFGMRMRGSFTHNKP
jgi:hypothetical protein